MAGSPAPRYDRPDATEHPAYFAKYIELVPEGDVLATLEAQRDELARTFGTIPEARGDFAYAPGKWTIKELLCHVIDAERVFAYRAMRFARGDQTPLPGFDENVWAPASGANDRTLADLVEELMAVRGATLALFRHLPADSAGRRGVASGKDVSVRALAYVIAGHPAHHLRVLRERYLV